MYAVIFHFFLQERMEELRSAHRAQIDAQMSVEYKGLDELRRQDDEQLRLDEERLALLHESSIENLQRSMCQKQAQLTRVNSQLATAQADHEQISRQISVQMAEVSRVSFSFFLNSHNDI